MSRGARITWHVGFVASRSPANQLRKCPGLSRSLVGPNGVPSGVKSYACLSPALRSPPSPKHGAQRGRERALLERFSYDGLEEHRGIVRYGYTRISCFLLRFFPPGVPY